MGIPGSLAVLAWLISAAPASAKAVEVAVPRAPVGAASLAAGLALPSSIVAAPLATDRLLWGNPATSKPVVQFGDRARLGYLRADQPIDFDGDALRRYRAALAQAPEHPSARLAAPVVAAAAELAGSGGIAVEPVGVLWRGEEQPGLRVTPLPQGSRLNVLAHRLLTKLGAALDYVPGRTGGATGAFNGVESRLLAPGFLHEESYPGLLHEIRHAFFSLRLKRGDMRLFHLSAVSRAGAPLAPGADSYAQYVSFEELSTFPKTLRHMLSLIRSAPDAGTLALRKELLRARARQYASILKTADHLMRRVRSLDAAGRLRADALAPEDGMNRSLESPDGGALYRVPLGHADLYLPIERPPRTLPWYLRLLGKKDDVALEVLRVKAEETLALVAESSTELAALWESLSAESPDWSAVRARSDRLVALAAAKDRVFRDRNPAK
ncbi:MAG: hypothetical protein HY553_08445 [Elusimicrobia bacterium]|nr:hypothetical protein [Elusimicrobiota bacterium]